LPPRKVKRHFKNSKEVMVMGVDRSSFRFAQTCESSSDPSSIDRGVSIIHDRIGVRARSK
jgi:hypothetical protein